MGKFFGNDTERLYREAIRNGLCHDHLNELQDEDSNLNLAPNVQQYTNYYHHKAFTYIRSSILKIVLNELQTDSTRVKDALNKIFPSTSFESLNETEKEKFFRDIQILDSITVDILLRLSKTCCCGCIYLSKTNGSLIEEVQKFINRDAFVKSRFTQMIDEFRTRYKDVQPEILSYCCLSSLLILREKIIKVKMKDAIVEVDKFGTLFDDNLYKIGLRAFKAGDYAAAVNCYSSAVKENSCYFNMPLLESLRDAYKALNKTVEADMAGYILFVTDSLSYSTCPVISQREPHSQCNGHISKQIKIELPLELNRVLVKDISLKHSNANHNCDTTPKAIVSATSDNSGASNDTQSCSAEISLKTVELGQDSCDTDNFYFTDELVEKDANDLCEDLKSNATVEISDFLVKSIDSSEGAGATLQNLIADDASVNENNSNKMARHNEVTNGEEKMIVENGISGSLSDLDNSDLLDLQFVPDLEEPSDTDESHHDEHVPDLEEPFDSEESKHTEVETEFKDEVHSTISSECFTDNFTESRSEEIAVIAKDIVEKKPTSKSAEVMNSILRQASEALLIGNGRMAVLKYQEVLSDTQNLPQDTEDMLVCIKYALAIAYCKIGGYSDLQNGIDICMSIIKDHDSFPIAYYCIGHAHRLCNRFKDALNYLQILEKILDKGIKMKVCNWPAIVNIIPESQTEHLKELVKNLINECENPPSHIAICRHRACYFQPLIYYSDPDFRGFLTLHCSDQCTLQYHPQCWKEVKKEKNKTEKDFLDKSCFTPDCQGNVCKIEMTNKEGEQNKTFEVQDKKKGQKPKKLKVEKKVDGKRRKRKDSRRDSETAEEKSEEKPISKSSSSQPTENNLKLSAVTTEEKKGDPSTNEINSNLSANAEAFVYMKEKVIQKNPAKPINRHKGSKKTKCTYSINEFQQREASDNEYYDSEDEVVMKTRPGISYSAAAASSPPAQEMEPSWLLTAPRYNISSEWSSGSQLKAYSATSRGIEISRNAPPIERIYKKFEVLLREGPLDVNSPAVNYWLENLSGEESLLIVEFGGVAAILSNDPRFGVVKERFICLAYDLPLVYSKYSSQGDDEHSPESNLLPGLNPDALEYIPGHTNARQAKAEQERRFTEALSRMKNARMKYQDALLRMNEETSVVEASPPARNFHSSPEFKSTLSSLRQPLNADPPIKTQITLKTSSREPQRLELLDDDTKVEKLINVIQGALKAYKKMPAHQPHIDACIKPFAISEKKPKSSKECQTVQESSKVSRETMTQECANSFEKERIAHDAREQHLMESLKEKEEQFVELQDRFTVQKNMNQASNAKLQEEIEMLKDENAKLQADQAKLSKELKATRESNSEVKDLKKRASDAEVQINSYKTSLISANAQISELMQEAEKIKEENTVKNAKHRDEMMKLENAHALAMKKCFANDSFKEEKQMGIVKKDIKLLLDYLVDELDLRKNEFIARASEQLLPLQEKLRTFHFSEEVKVYVNEQVKAIEIKILENDKFCSSFRENVQQVKQKIEDLTSNTDNYKNSIHGLLALYMRQIVVLRPHVPQMSSSVATAVTPSTSAIPTTSYSAASNCATAIVSGGATAENNTNVDVDATVQLGARPKETHLPRRPPGFCPSDSDSSSSGSITGIQDVKHRKGTSSHNHTRSKALVSGSMSSTSKSVEEKGDTKFHVILQKLMQQHPYFNEAQMKSLVNETRKQNSHIRQWKASDYFQKVDALIQTRSKAIQQSSKSRNVPAPKLKNLAKPPAAPQPLPPAARKTWDSVGNRESEFTESMDTDCAICIDKIQPRDSMKTDCGHVFHRQCIEAWLVKTSNCPTCRKLVLRSEDYPSLS